jgi:hypothetical protein
VSETLSPKMIISGERLDWKRHLALPFGAYCQVHEQDEVGRSDINKERTLGAICLGPSDNQTSGYRFMSLQTGRKVTRTAWTELPMPNQVIERVHSLALDQPEKLVFYDRHGRAIGDNSSNIELSEIDTGIERTNQITRQLNESIQSETHESHEFEQDGIADEEEMSLPIATHGTEHTNTDDENGQDQPPDRTNTIDFEESNLVSQTVDSLERGE